MIDQSYHHDNNINLLDQKQNALETLQTYLQSIKNDEIMKSRKYKKYLKRDIHSISDIQNELYSLSEKLNTANTKSQLIEKSVKDNIKDLEKQQQEMTDSLKQKI